MPHISIRVTNEEKAQYRELADTDGRDLTKIIKDYLSNLISRTLPRKK